MHLRNGGGGIIVTNEATVTNGTIGVMIAGRSTLHRGTRVLLNTPQAAALGAAFDLIYVIGRRWLPCYTFNTPFVQRLQRHIIQRCHNQIGSGSLQQRFVVEPRNTDRGHVAGLGRLHP